MMSDQIHRAVSADGTEIAGRVHGQGPSLVLFHGAPHDGDLAWEALVPHPLTGSPATCRAGAGEGSPPTARTTRPHATRRTPPRSSTASAGRSTWPAGQPAS
jgi:hypothetical protein